MLVLDSELDYKLIYLGPGNGCRRVLRCDAIAFEIELDCNNPVKAMQEAVQTIEGLIFEAFHAGTYRFQPSERQTKAERCKELPDSALVTRMYDTDTFVAVFARHEMKRRGIWDEDIYRIGAFGNHLSQSQAISLLRTKLEN